jgi:hypothetical protein
MTATIVEVLNDVAAVVWDAEIIGPADAKVAYLQIKVRVHEGRRDMRGHLDDERVTAGARTLVEGHCHGRKGSTVTPRTNSRTARVRLAGWCHRG